MPPQNSFPQILLSFLLIISTISFSCAKFNNDSSDILYDASPYSIVYKNGTFRRLIEVDDVPPSPNPTAGIRSKDVVIDHRRNISARLFLPENAAPTRKLPLLVYFHGCAFVCESAFSKTYHNYLNSIVEKAKVVAVSVNYRLAREYPLPIGYQDSWHALEWALSQIQGNGNESWVRDYVDLNRVYLGGDSAGGNIAHNVGIRVGLEKRGSFELMGIFLGFPHFWGNEAIGRERKDPKQVACEENIWRIAYPNSTGLDDPALNPSMDPSIWKLGSKRVLVYVAENDVLRDRGVYYVETLRKSNWSGVAEVVEVMGVGHIFNLISPNSTKANDMDQHFASFLNGPQIQSPILLNTTHADW